MEEKRLSDVIKYEEHIEPYRLVEVISGVLAYKKAYPKPSYEGVFLHRWLKRTCNKLHFTFNIAFAVFCNFFFANFFAFSKHGAYMCVWTEYLCIFK